MIDFSDLYVGENKSSNKNKSTSPLISKRDLFLGAAVLIGCGLWYGRVVSREAFKHDAEQMTKEQKAPHVTPVEENSKSEAYQLKR